MAHLSPTTAHDVSEIKIIKTKGQTVDWYTIYLDDIHICSAFGTNKKLPDIITYAIDNPFDPLSSSSREGT